MMNGYEVKEKLFAKEKIEVSKDDYQKSVRQVILDYKDRSADLGQTDLVNHCTSEINRLDKEFEV